MTKLMTLTLMMCFVDIVSFGQVNEHYLKNNIFYTTFETGIGEKVPMEFQIDSIYLLKIQETNVYKNWDSVTFLNPANFKFIERWKHLTHIEMFLMSETNMASFYAKLELKNEDSYIPINGKSSIAVKEEKISIVFPLKAQNGYGNFIISKAYYIMEWVNGQKKILNFLSN